MTLDKTRAIEFEGFRVVVAPASYQRGLYRTLLTEQARSEQVNPNPAEAQELAVVIGAVMIWPALIAATIEHSGFDHWPPSPAEVMEMPEGFVTEWEQATYALNPQWVAKPVEATNGPKVSNG